MTKTLLLARAMFSLLLLFLVNITYAQQKTVTGKVTGEEGVALLGATVAVQGTSVGTSTDAQGNFTLTVPAGGNTLLISFLGYETRRMIIGSQTNFTVQLETDKSKLTEVVVVGYGTQKRKDLTGSVSSVNGAQIKNQPVTNVTEALQGRAAGVEIIKNSGQPDAQPTIIIRGLSSLHQPGPLYIVDGVRVPGDNINVQDIATIDILKDASAAAIYGSAAAGGVIVITTKKGSGSKPSINFNARYGVTKPKLVKMLGKEDYIKMENILNPTFFDDATQTDTLANTDWVDVLYRDGMEQNYNLSVAGSSPVVSYLFSGFYNKQDGIFIKNYSNIGGFRINTDYKLGKFIKIGEQLAISRRKTSPLGPVESMMKNAPFRSLPIVPLYEKDGRIGTLPPGYGISFGAPNPLGVVNSADMENFKNNLQGNVYAEIKLPFNFSFRSNLGYSYYDESQDYFQDNPNFGPGTPTSNSLTKSSVRSSQLLSNYVLTYDQAFGKHNVNVLGGFEQIVSKYNNVSTRMTAVGLPGFSFVQTSNSQITTFGKNDPNGLVKSWFGRANYNYDNRYYISGSIRQDANFTVFGPNKQKGTFGAVSAGWNISDEEFFKQNVSFINLLKLRGSYGSLGNSSIPPYAYLASYAMFQGTSGNANGGQNFAPGAPLVIANSINAIPNPDLQWETVYETNIGLDGELLAGKLYFTAEWYNKRTKDMLYSLRLPLSAGYKGNYLVNIGEVSSKGVDVLLGYRDKAGDFSYDISASAGFNKNKVVDLSGITNDALFDGRNYYNNLDESGFNLMGTNALTITKAGLPFGSFYGYKSLGIFQTDAEAATQKVGGKVAHAGDLIFEDIDKDGNITIADRQVLGNPNPKVVFGANVRLNWKGVDVAMLFNGVAGVDIFNGVKAYSMYRFADGNTTSKIFGASFFGDNGLTSQPRVQAPDGSLDPNGNYTSVNSYFVESGNYVKLKNLQIGYTFTNDFLRKVSISSARIFGMANNVLTFSKYSGQDPEIGSSYSSQAATGLVGSTVGVTTRGVDALPQYPQTRIFSVGLDINF
ncbi:SusC/RagA family TonB-linked outer membrane protein [uncultured Chitinophaga sp.]|uniref:SusC/RagA family TonB-linked outer membrane protein n=1 Tax=uncultured Chitinophaga sp. TaxID=339340 RepID=UPI0025F9AEF1|nr:SusC/RagA family TonB-linked outer membrane protein [uncultured Chitinophaga sp.]